MNTEGLSAVTKRQLFMNTLGRIMPTTIGCGVGWSIGGWITGTFSAKELFAIVFTGFLVSVNVYRGIRDEWAAGR